MTIGSLEILTDDQSNKVVDLVDELEKVWIRRETEPMDFFTVGACTYIDGVESLEKYDYHRELMNPVLKKSFSWLYDIVIEKFSQILGSVEVVNDLGYPGFHIFGHKPGQVSHPFCVDMFQVPLASLHFDHQYRQHTRYWELFNEVDLDETFTFTIPVELPKNGGGLWLWNWKELGVDALLNFNFQDSDGTDIAFKKYMDDMDPRECKNAWKDKVSPILFENDPIYDTKPMVLPYKVGRACYHIGPIWHQIMPGYELSDTDRRITLQGHGVKCDGIWRLYF